MLRAAANGLHRGPHVLVGAHQIPASSEELSALDSAAFVDLFGAAGHASSYRLAPGDVAVALDDGVRLAAFQSLFREKGGVNAAVDDPCSTGSRQAAHLVAAKGVAGMNTDADDVPGLNAFGVDLLERFVDEDGGAGRFGCCRRKYEEPAGCDDCRTEGIVAWVY
jgi:hypothetical protein